MHAWSVTANLRDEIAWVTELNSAQITHFILNNGCFHGSCKQLYLKWIFSDCTLDCNHFGRRYITVFVVMHMATTTVWLQRLKKATE